MQVTDPTPEEDLGATIGIAVLIGFVIIIGLALIFVK